MAPLVAIAVCFSARGATIVWLGGTGGNANIWNRKQSWNPQSIPTANDTAQFDNTSTAGNLSPSIGVTNTSVGAISFISGTTFAYNISGTAILTVGSATVSGIANSSAANQQFSVSTLALGINQSWTAGGTGNLSFSSAVSLGTRTLTLTGSSTGIGNISGLISGTGAIVKSGTGTWALSGANTFSGTTTVSQGTLQIDSNAPSGSAGALGNATSAVTLNNAGTGANNTALLIGTDGVTIGRTITVANAGTGTTSLGGNLTSGVGTFSGAITLNKSASLTADGASNVTFSSVIGGTGAGITKTGIGTVTLSGSNTYTGATTISQGTLQLNANAPSGAAGTLGNASSAVNINDSNTSANNTALMIGANGVTVARDINVVNFGTGVTTLGGNITSGSGTFSGGVTLNKSAALNADGTSTIDFTGVVSGTGNITKTGDGTVTLGGSGANLFLGTATVNAGTLALAKTGGALAINGNIIIGDASGTDTVRLDGANQIASTSTVTLNDSGGTPTLNLNGFSQTLGSISSANTGAQVLLGSPGSATTLTVGNASSTTFAGVISGGNNAALTKTGTGSVTLSGANTYSGLTTISQGTLVASGSSALGASTGNVTVSSGATLALAGGATVTKSAPLSLLGTGTSSSVGALHSAGGTGTTSQWSGNISLAGNATITAADNLLILGEGNTFTNTLNLGSNTLTLHTPSAAVVTPTFLPDPGYLLDASNIVVNSVISGTGGIVKTGAGTVNVVSGAIGGNTFTGATVITGGKLIVDANENMPGINSTQIYVGNSSASPGTADSVVLQMGQLASTPSASNIIGTWNVGTNASSSNLTVYSDGVFKMNNGSNGFTSLTLQGGHVDSGNPVYNATLTLGGSLTTLASSRTALIEHGNLGLSATNFTFTIATGTTASGVDLQIDSVVQNGIGYTGGSAGTSFIKAGTGKLVLTNANTYSGLTNVSAGILNLSHGLALGQTGTFYGDTANGTVVQSGAQLQLQGGITVGSFESLTLSGSGISNNGALRNLGGNNTYNGFVYLASDSRINADTGTTLTIANTSGVNSTIINGTAAGKSLTVGGDGDTIVSGGISSFVDNLTKDGSGTLTVAGLNSYAGATTVSAGAVKVTHGSGLAGTGVVVNSGAALQFAQDGNGNNISVVGVGATINGSGPSSGGAIQNLTGSNTYAGLVTLGSGSLITANSGTSLTLSGGIGTAAQGLIVGTAANNGNITVSGNVSGGGSLTKAGTGSLTFSGASTTLGTVNMNAGTLTFSGTAVSTGAVHLAGGSIFVSSSTTATTGAIDAVAGTTLTIASGGSIAANYAAGTTTFSGALAGAGEFQKDGAGVLVFNNTFTASNLTLTLNGGTLSLLGGQFTFGTIHITGNTVLDFNNSTGTFLSSGNLIIDAGVTVTVNNWTSVANNAALSTVWYASNTINGGTLGGISQVGGTPLSQIGFTNYNGLTATWVSGTPNGWFNHEIRPTPEPSTYGLILVAGCVGVIGFRRYRRNRTSAT